MSGNKTDIYVYAHWKGMADPVMMGVLSAHQAKGKKAFGFEYDKQWVGSAQRRLIDPDIQFYSGVQYPRDKDNFGVFLDSMPDTWGRTLMKRKEVLQASREGRSVRSMHDINYLLGVYDESRMGALRFKTDPQGSFLDSDTTVSTPPWISVRELQHAANRIEEEHSSTEIVHELAILLAPGSSLGGARPKANIIDEKKNLWIAKFPSKNDQVDKGAWEFLAYELAVRAGIRMSPCRIEKVAGKYHTFFTKRFDREKKERIHFSSAMTMTGYNEDLLRGTTASYLEIAEFIQVNGAAVEENLHQLWRRIVFNICISNTDDHLRNHGFLLTDAGWVLSPAYDLNPSVDKGGLNLNIDMDSNMLDLELAKSVGDLFRLDLSGMNKIINEVLQVVKGWEGFAKEIGISRYEREIMAEAFLLR